MVLIFYHGKDHFSIPIYAYSLSFSDFWIYLKAPLSLVIGNSPDRGNVTK